MQEPEKPYVLEILKDALNLMQIKPSSKNALLAYNLLLKLKSKEEIRNEPKQKQSGSKIL